MPLVKEKRLNINYYKLLPGGAPYQLIEGELIMTPTPNPRHQIILGRLFMALSKVIEKRGSGIVLVSPIDLYLDDENAFQPDILFIQNKAFIKKDGIYGPPDIVIEILSPSTAHYDLKEKFKVYERSGVKEYWIVDPDMNTIELYVNEEKGFSIKVKAEAKGEIGSSILEGFKVDLEDIFRELL
jgi:Uma2 family endonuclease